MIFSFTTPERMNNETLTGKNASGAHFDAPKPTCDGFSIEIYGTLDAETKEKFSATDFPIKYFDTRLGYSRCRK